MHYPWLQPSTERLFALCQQQALPHALLLSGPAGIGKHIVAKGLAGYLLCRHPADRACGSCKSCLLVKAGHHPDLWQPDSEHHIGVDTVRQLTGFMQGASQQQGA